MSDPKTTGADEAQNLPATGSEDEELPATIPSFGTLPVSLQIFFNDNLFNRCKQVAGYLAKAEGFTPRHLIGKPEACFAVISRALTWRLDPYAVAQACYQTPGGTVGYFGSLCQAIIENSGRLIGGVKFEHYGDWQKLRGQFKIATNDKGSKYPAPSWEQFGPIEEGLGVAVSARMKDEDQRREMNFDLIQAYPRNSTLWATDPRTQIQYTAVRRFATSTVPTLFMGVPFDHEELEDWVTSLRDVTPARPEADEFAEQPRGRSRRRGAAPAAEPAAAAGNGAAAPETAQQGQDQAQTEPEKLYFFNDEFGEIHEFADANDAVGDYAARLEKARSDRPKLQAVWSNGATLLSALREHGQAASADALNSQYGELVGELNQVEAENDAEAARAGAGAQPAAESAQPGAQPAQEPAYDVAVPLTEGQPINQWHMAARARLKEMHEAARPAADFVRFREVNATALARLHAELRSWSTMLVKEIDRGAAGTPA